MKDYIMGNQAIAAGALQAGVKVVTGYPGTPATEIVEQCAKAENVYVEWSVNEKVAMEVALMASLCNVRSMAVMKHNGTNVATDILMHLNFTGVKGGMVIISADDPGANSSQNEEDTRITTHIYGHLLVLDPSSAAEAKEMTTEAFAYSETFETAVVLRPVMRICHARSIIETGAERESGKQPQFEDDRSRFVMSAVSEAKAGGKMRPLWRHKILNDKQKEFTSFAENSRFNVIEKGDGQVGFVGCGIGYAYIKEAESLGGRKVPILKIATLPPPSEKIKTFCHSCQVVVVLEEIEPVVENIIKQICQEEGLSTKILGRGNFLPSEGELSTEIVLDSMNKLGMDMVERGGKYALDINVPMRTRTQCVGCPHRGLLSALKQVARKHKAVVAGDIGCHDAGSFPPYNLQSTIYCMGSSIPMAHGFRTSGINRPVAAVIGDSTFYHSGLTGLINAIYNQSDLTVIICDNSTTAMTGFQPHPGSGVNIRGTSAPVIDARKIGEALGILTVSVNPYDLDDCKKVLDEVLPQKGVKLVISRALCYLTAKRLGVETFAPKEIRLDPEKCNGCKICINDLGCPALKYSDGKVQINLGVCVKCGLCGNVCRKGAIAVCS